MKPKALVTRKLLPEAQDLLDRYLDMFKAEPNIKPELLEDDSRVESAGVGWDGSSGKG